MNGTEKLNEPKRRVSANIEGANNLDLITYARDIETGADPQKIKEDVLKSKTNKENLRIQASIRNNNGGRATSTDLSIGAEGIEF